MNKKDMNSRIALIEHFITKCSMAIDAARQSASLNEQLVDKMQYNIVTFTFKKADGTIRVAKGTLRSDMLPEIKGTGRPLSFGLQLYYDVDKQSFRSFKKENLISIEL